METASVNAFRPLPPSSTIVSTAFVFFFSAQAVNADVKVVAHVSVQRLPSDDKVLDQTDTFYFQGDRSRVDLPGNVTLIFDNGADKLYQLDPTLKTYRVGSIKNAEDFKTLLSQQQTAKLNVSESLTFNASSDQANYLSSPSTSETLSGESRITRERGQGGGGHRRHGGGLFPGGGGWGGGGGGGWGGGGGGGGDWGSGGGGGSQGGGGARYPVYEIAGSIWTSDAYKLPEAKHVIVEPIALEMAYADGPFVGDLVKHLDQGHKFPLHAEVSVLQTYPTEYGDDSSSHPDQKFVTTFDVQSISTGTGDDSFFAVPSDYTLDPSPVTLPNLTAGLDHNGN